MLVVADNVGPVDTVGRVDPYTPSMSTLAEIEAAADALAAAEKQELLLFLAARLRGESGPLPAPRKFPREQLDAWIAEDDADMQRLRGSEAR